MIILKNEERYQKIGYLNDDLKEKLAMCEKTLERNGHFTVGFTHNANTSKYYYYYKWEEVFDSYFRELNQKKVYSSGQYWEIKYYKDEEE